MHVFVWSSSCVPVSEAGRRSITYRSLLLLVRGGKIMMRSGYKSVICIWVTSILYLELLLHGLGVRTDSLSRGFKTVRPFGPVGYRDRNLRLHDRNVQHWSSVLRIFAIFSALKIHNSIFLSTVTSLLLSFLLRMTCSFCNDFWLEMLNKCLRNLGEW